MMKRLTAAQLKEYLETKDKRPHKETIMVDDKHRKNLQAWVNYEIWIEARAKAASLDMSMNEFIEQAVGVYLLLDEEEVTGILMKKVK